MNIVKKMTVLGLAVALSGTALAQEMEVPHQHEKHGEGGTGHSGAEPMMDPFSVNPTQGMIDLFSITDAEGNMYRAWADVEDVEASPEWEGKGLPPLSMEAAAVAALEALREAYPLFPTQELEEITMAKVYHHGLENRWMYHVRVKAKGRLAHVTVETDFQASVLMDGTVIVPQLVEHPEMENESE